MCSGSVCRLCLGHLWPVGLGSFCYIAFFGMLISGFLVWFFLYGVSVMWIWGDSHM